MLDVIKVYSTRLCVINLINIKMSELDRGVPKPLSVRSYDNPSEFVTEVKSIPVGMRTSRVWNHVH